MSWLRRFTEAPESMRMLTLVCPISTCVSGWLPELVLTVKRYRPIHRDPFCCSLTLRTFPFGFGGDLQYLAKCPIF